MATQLFYLRQLFGQLQLRQLRELRRDGGDGGGGGTTSVPTEIDVGGFLDALEDLDVAVPDGDASTS